MSDIITPDKKINLCINRTSEHVYITKLGRALSSADRLRVLNLLQQKPSNLIEISQKLNLPISSVSKHIDALADAQLILINYMPGLKGHIKMCSKTVMAATVLFEDELSAEENDDFTAEMPLGQFTECDITAPCGLVGINGQITPVDMPQLFFSPKRADTELLWFNSGFITYMFPNPAANNNRFSDISFSFEACSEAPYYQNNWPSDITVIINETEIATYTSPGDYGGRRGIYTPEFWPINSTQFGTLENFTVSANGVYHNMRAVNKNITFADLGIDKNPYIKFTIGIKENAVHRGGINLFGKRFGDAPQSIIMKLR